MRTWRGRCQPITIISVIHENVNREKNDAEAKGISGASSIDLYGARGGSTGSQSWYLFQRKRYGTIIRA